jgi:hypothetical protein
MGGELARMVKGVREDRGEQGHSAQPKSWREARDSGRHLREPEEESRARTYSLEILDRHTLQLGTGALAERGVALLLLTLLQGEDALFDGVGDDEPVDKDLERAAVIGGRSAWILRGEPGSAAAPPSAGPGGGHGRAPGSRWRRSTRGQAAGGVESRGQSKESGGATADRGEGRTLTTRLARTRLRPCKTSKSVN